MNFASTVNGCSIDLVCSVKVFDDSHGAHLLVSRDGHEFLFTGCLNAGFHAYTILDGTLKQQFPVPIVVSTNQTRILEHHAPSWESLKAVVDLCAGFGGLAQGATAAGFDVRVAIDQNQKMLNLYSKVGQAHTIHGDIGDKEVLCEAWKSSAGAATVTSGFSCQPFSRLGDGKGQADTRANCLTKTLRTAYYLNAQLIVLECVSPAAQDSFVKGEIAHFTKHTGFHCTMTELKLDSVWPCRRHRAWWVLSAPSLGPIDLQTWPCFSNVQHVMHVIPEIRLWAAEDENQLALDDVELDAFGVNEDRHAKYLLNGKSKAPCALHAWGSQTRACPCGCRPCGFSKFRLESKGLHGCLTRSAVFPDGTTKLRHLHPNEVMGLNTFDPIVDFGPDVRLTLSAVGQLACPAQALWVMSSILEKLDSLRKDTTFSPSAQVQAYRSWLLMRCRQVWPTSQEPIDDPKLVALMAHWKNHQNLSLTELLFPMRWENMIEGTVSIAAVLDHLIKQHEATPPTIPDADSKGDFEEVPYFDFPDIVDDPETVGGLCADSCTVHFANSQESPVKFHPKCASTVAQFLSAQGKLVGSFEIESAKMGGKLIPMDHVMEVGQVIVIHIREVEPEVQHPLLDVSPTAAWTQPPTEMQECPSPPRKISKFDVGECVVPASILPTDHAWLDASPLYGLQGEQFLKLSLPCIQNAQQLWSLRHQFVRTADRLTIMDCQAQFWAGDEIRFHVNDVIQSCQATQAKNGFPVVQVCTIDPLIATAWIQNRGFDCQLWARDHAEIREKGVSIFMVVLIDKHWVPVYMSPLRDVLHVHTWDGMGASHEGLDELVNKLAIALGFTSALVNREHRLFFTSELCGALAIAFLRYALCGAQLPSDCTEATVIHSRLKDMYAKELSRCQIARRPWVWGAGDNPSSSADGMRSSSDLHLAVNITRDQRIDLINEKGMALGDDEMRFHIMQLVSHQPDSHLPAAERRFIFMEPLIFNCWDSIGHVIAKQWCTRNPQILEKGQNIVTAVELEDHWLPLWAVPSGPTLQIHTFHSEVSFAMVENVLETLANALGFQSFAVHRIPTRLPDHVMCGAHALALIAHVIMQMPLPDDLAELRALHTNMRASFVAHLYSIEYTPKPVVWGFGATGESGPLPVMPDAETEARDSNRTLRLQMLTTHSYAMGDDEIYFHLCHLIACHLQGPRAVGPVRQFVTVPPKTLDLWLSGEIEPLQTLVAQEWLPKQPDRHLIAVILLNQHWVPLWFAPVEEAVHCHTLADFAIDDTVLEDAAKQLSQVLGFAEVVVHKVPHGLDVTRLCGTMAISFLAHILLRTRLPDDVHQLRSRCWDMKSIFAQAIESSDPTFPELWGWGHERECRPLPRMPAANPFEMALDGLVDTSFIVNSLIAEFAGITVSQAKGPVPCGMHQFEMKFHLQALNRITSSCVEFHVALGDDALTAFTKWFQQHTLHVLGLACLKDLHWFPVIFLRQGDEIIVVTDCPDFVALLGNIAPDYFVCQVIPTHTVICGVVTWKVFAWMCGFPTDLVSPSDMRSLLHHLYLDHAFGMTDPRLLQWGFGSHGPLAKQLASELLKHGVPETVVEERAANAIRTLGSEQISAALNHRNTWKQLKMLGNNSKFQFVMPSELSTLVDANKGKPVAGKGKGKGARVIPQPVELDPTKLVVLEGTFHSQDVPMPQLTMQQIGPVSSGIILMSQQDAEPYLRAGKVVSREPLALLVLHRNGAEITTALPHSSVMVPCRCTLNNEPVLAGAVLVQVGTGMVEKISGKAIVSVDTPDVVTLKVMIYKDEMKGEWTEINGSPIRCLVSLLPKLKRCFTESCSCPAWHNAESLPLRDPILDVWRRQFLRLGFKPCPADKAEIFSVCIRIPRCILDSLLASSGTSGAYGQPTARRFFLISQ